jgi:hypothetical protein
MPARCSDGILHEGYDCIHGVCAAPGTPIPITIAQVENLRGVDLKLVPQQGSAVVVWQTYAYSPEGQRFRGARVTAAGEVSATMDLVTSFVADEGAVEPFYDVLPVSDEELLLAVSASPLPDDASPKARLLTYRVRLPPAGQEARGGQFEAAWGAEERMETAGYGAVSRPKLVARGNGVELGYVQTKVLDNGMSGEVIGELMLFQLAMDGRLDEGVPVNPLAFPARDGQAVAVGVTAGFARGEATWWVFDDVRPSAFLVSDAGLRAEEPLARLGIALDATDASLLYLEPSERTGDKLPTDPVSGAAALRRVDAVPDPGGMTFTFSDAPLGEVAPVRDAPRPAWISREGQPALLVTPGASIDAPALLVYRVDPAIGAATEAARIERFSSAQVGATEAVLAGGRLFVAWIDVSETAATIRMAAIPEP